MTTLGEIIHQYGATYRAQYAEQLLPSQQAALQAIEQCHTEALGGHVYSCPACGAHRYSYHAWLDDVQEHGSPRTLTAYADSGRSPVRP